MNSQALSWRIDDLMLVNGAANQHRRWNKLLLIKVSVFVWRVCKGRIHVRAELDSKGIDLHSVLCPSCDDEIKIWDRVFNWWICDARQIVDIAGLLKLDNNNISSKWVNMSWKL